ncbi:hypothetical protein R6Q57_013217 [Mikania cordata]
MPHRATYFFPRGVEGVVLDHEKLSEGVSGSLMNDGDHVKKKNTKKQLSDLVSWLGEEKGAGGSGWGHMRFSQLGGDDNNTCHDVENGDLKDVIRDHDDHQTAHEGNKGFDGGKGDDSQWSLVRNWCKNFYLQLNLAKQLTRQAVIREGPSPGQDDGYDVVSCDAESTSYRLWVNGTLSYTDKVSDGFYNILGMDPYMWMMCNNYVEGTRMPSLSELKAVEPTSSSLEVVVVNRYKDSRLRELEDIAEELSYMAENALMLAEKLAKLVAASMGGSFSIEQGDLLVQRESISKRIKELQSNILVPIGSLSAGLCRHRAILFKKLADYVGLPCRIARGCKYCVEDHRSTCLVRIEDDKFTRSSPKICTP